MSNTRSKPKRHLAQNLPSGTLVNQYGALCVRYDPADGKRVLLITTRQTRRWTIPKGWPIKGLDGAQVAERESWEEAGVKGKASKKPFGHFAYMKVMENGTFVPTLVEVHLVSVRKQSREFPEAGQREIEWLPPEVAAERVLEPELKGILLRFARENG